MALSRATAVLVGFAILVAYTAVAAVGTTVLLWVVASPPGLFTAVGAFVVGVVLASFVGHRMGPVRLVASLRARPLSPAQAPELHRRLSRLTHAMALRQPPILVADLGAPNALSVGGPRQGAVVLDHRLLGLLTIDELEAILAHELAHIERYDTFVNTVLLTAVRTLVGLVFLVLFPLMVFLAGLDRALGWFAGRPGTQVGLVGLFRLGVLLVLGVVLGLFTLGALAYSRRQEYAADRRAAEVTGNPAALARALAKIHRANEPEGMLRSLIYIHDDRRPERSLLSTHPPLGDRIDRLLAQADREQRQYRHGIEREFL